MDWQHIQEEAALEVRWRGPKACAYARYRLFRELAYWADNNEMWAMMYEESMVRKLAELWRDDSKEEKWTL